MSRVSHFFRHPRFLFLLLIVFSVPCALAETVVKQLHVITRHGSRYPLEKEASNLQENTPGSLTPFGQRQMFDLGKWLKDEYNATGFFNIYVPWEVRLESSAFDRTLVSADSLALGAFDYLARDPHQESLLQQLPANIPVYSTDVENDVYLRAYDKCPTFHDRLMALYNSREWLDLEQEHDALLRRLASLESFQQDADESDKIPLVNLWNVYDAIHVAKTECTASGDGFTPTCYSLPNPFDRDALTDAEFQELEILAALVEQMRYGPDLAGRLLGGPLLMRIIDRMLRHTSGNFFLYSAHYPTILGVLAALGERLPTAKTIPDYASALIFVLQEDTITGLQHIQVVYKADSQLLTPPTVLTLDFCVNEATCPAATFFGRWKDWTLYEWCRECDNRNARVCLDYLVEEYENDSMGLDKPLQTGLLIGFGVSFLVAILTCVLCFSPKVKWESGTKTQQEHAPTPPEQRSNDGDGDDSFSSVEMADSNETKKEPVMA